MSQSLATVVKTNRAKLGLSVRDVANRSGGMLSSTTVSAIERGLRTSFDERTLEGLARGLSLPQGVIDKAAGAPVSDELGDFVLPKRAARLNRKEREHVLALVDLLLERRTAR